MEPFIATQPGRVNYNQEFSKSKDPTVSVRTQMILFCLVTIMDHGRWRTNKCFNTDCLSLEKEKKNY